MSKYIDKDALVAELKERISDYWSDSENTMGIYPYALEDVIKYINTLEVKEVDLDFQRFAKEMNAIFALPSSETKNTEEEPLNWEFAIAKHFFELGLQVQKGE